MPPAPSNQPYLYSRLAYAPAGQSIESERRLDFRQRQPRRLLRCDLLHVQRVKVVGQFLLIRQQRTQLLVGGKRDYGESG